MMTKTSNKPVRKDTIDYGIRENMVLNRVVWKSKSHKVDARKMVKVLMMTLSRPKATHAQLSQL